MTIRKKLLLLTLVPVLLVLALGATLYVAFARAGRSRRNAAGAQAVVEGVFELNLLSHEYLQHRADRARDQWTRKHASLRQQLLQLDFPAIEEQEALAGSVKIHGELASLFSQLTRSHANADLPKPEKAVLREFRRRLTAQLLAKSHALISHASRLAKAGNARTSAVERRTKVLVVALAAAVAIVVAIASLRASRTITRAMARLHEGTEIVGAGNLDHRIGYYGQDEIGELARSFDRMTQRLEDVTVSREELTEEVRAHERTEARLRETMAELERSNSDLEQFSSVASHDLQEPLRVVSSFVQLLAKRYRGKLDSDADEFIEFAVDGAKRMRRLINDLLEYSRVGTRGKPFAAVDADDVVVEALANLAAAAAENNAEITRDDLPSVTGDRTQLAQLFQNLIGNAIKFHGDRPPRVHVSAERNGKEWTFSVRDNGIGIDPKYAGQIFVIFRRLHTPAEYSGTGIGLAVCKRIVERHEGRIWFESTPGKGTTFSFTIPDRKENRHDELPNERKTR